MRCLQIQSSIPIPNLRKLRLVSKGRERLSFAVRQLGDRLERSSLWSLIDKASQTIYWLGSSLRGVSYTASIRTSKRRYYFLLLLACVPVLLLLLELRVEPVVPLQKASSQEPSVRNIPLTRQNTFVERWGDFLYERVVKVEVIRMTSGISGSSPNSESVVVRPNEERAISRPRASDICSRHNRRKVVYYRGKYKYWRCIR